MFTYKEHMTLEQLNCVNAFEQICEAEAKLCVSKLQETIRSHIPLPATAHSGKPVLHGARCEIVALEHYWTKRLNALYLVVPDELFKKWTGHSSVVGIVKEAHENVKSIH